MMNHYASQHTIPDAGREREAAVQRVHVALAEASAHEYAEVWIDHNKFPALGGLIHADRGWLMLIRYDGDAGYSSRGADEAAHSAEDSISFSATDNATCTPSHGPCRQLTY